MSAPAIFIRIVRVHDRLLPRQEERERQRALKALERLGDAVTLEKVA